MKTKKKIDKELYLLRKKTDRRSVMKYSMLMQDKIQYHLAIIKGHINDLTITDNIN